MKILYRIYQLFIVLPVIALGTLIIALTVTIGCTYGATPAASPAKGQELAPLKQPALLHAGDTASA